MSIFFATPMYGGMCTVGFQNSSLNLAIELTNVNMPFNWSTPFNESLITRARSKQVAEFLNSDYERLMFIDADIEFMPHDVATLWNLDVDIAVGAYPMKQLNCPASAWVNGKIVDLSELNSPTSIDYAGTGFMMIKREVIERMEKAYPELSVIDDRSGTLGAVSMLFDTNIKDSTYLSEDYAFCERWKALGGEIILDPTIHLKHWGTYIYGS